jgi:hypothetical protein
LEGFIDLLFNLVSVVFCKTRFLPRSELFHFPLAYARRAPQSLNLDAPLRVITNLFCKQALAAATNAPNAVVGPHFPT